MESERQATISLIPEKSVFFEENASEIDIIIEIKIGSNKSKDGAPQSLNLSLIIDRSGSMEGIKLETAKKCATKILENLNESDSLSVIAFDDKVISVINPQMSKKEAAQRISSLNSGGMTNLSNGWYYGLLELQTYSKDNSINRAILISDGQANRGETKASVLASESLKIRDEAGIVTSTIGIGGDFQEELLSSISDTSGGNFWFIDEYSIEEIINREFSGANATILQKPRVEVVFPDGLSVSKELNNLRKISNQYSIRPLMLGERYSFAQRLEVVQGFKTGDLLTGKVILYDADVEIAQSDFNFTSSSIDDFAAVESDPRVALEIGKFISAQAEEKLSAVIEGSTEEAVSVLSAQSDLLRDLRDKLSGTTQISWEEMTEEEARQAKQMQERLEAELNEIYEDLSENEALSAVLSLANILRSEGMDNAALDMLSFSSKSNYQRYNRKNNKRTRLERGSHDDQAIAYVLYQAKRLEKNIRAIAPHRQPELDVIYREINEKLQHFST